MCDIFRSLGNSLDLVDVLSTFDRKLRSLICYDAISVHLVDQARLTAAYAEGDDVANLLASAGHLDLLLRVVVERQAALNEECGRPCPLQIALVFPIENASAVIGILALYRRDLLQPFSDDHLDLLHVLNAKLCASIENARKFQLAAESAATDPVTHLANCRSLFEHLDAEVARARRGETRLAVLQCSIGGWDESDRFCLPESVRHESGRHAFEKVVLRLRESCREYDFTAQSGEDLVLVLPGFGPSGFAEKRGLIRNIVEEAGLSVGLPLFAVVGAAFYPEDGRDTEDLLAESSRRLNLAKRVASGVDHAAASLE